MARRATIRSRVLNTDVAQIETMIARDFNTIWKGHIEDLESIAEEVYDESTELVPVLTGKLKNSINVRMSKSRRYPYIIASARAIRHGFDYALVQEETEEPDFFHDDNKMAHYLAGPFAREISYWYEEITGDKMDLPENLQNAIYYIEERGG